MTGREEIDLKNEIWIKDKLLNCPQIIVDYMNSTIENKTSWSRRNYLGYLIQFINYLKDNGYDVDDLDTYKNIKPLDINKYISYISYRVVNGQKVKNKAGIKAAKLFAISDLFGFLVNNDIIEKNPCDKVETPKDKIEKEIVALSTDEVKTIQDNIISRGKGRCKKYSLRDLCIISLGVTTGLRVSAITEINMDDIDFDNNTITVTEKGNLTRNVIIGEKTKELLKKWIVERNKIMEGHNNTDALFISKNKSRISTSAVRRMISKDTTNIEKHVTPHKLRSTCATNLYEMTGDIYLVQNQLGHSNIQNTRRYAKVSNDKRIMAAEILNNII